MNKDDLFKVFLINDLMDLPNAVTKILDMDLEDRNKIYRELIRLNDNDLSYDWFQEVYESDLSERKAIAESNESLLSLSNNIKK